MIKLNSKDRKSVGTNIPGEIIRSPIHRKYRLTSVLKEDFLGVLYKSAKKTSGVNLGVKVLRPDFFIATDLIGKVDHSRIASVHDHMIDKSGLQAVVFRPPTGQCLSDLTREAHETTEGEAVSAVLQLLSALHAVHWCDEIVGNLHSDSIYLSRDQHDNLELQLINVGIGCFDDALEQPYYQAPEQISGSGTDHRVDIWAAGIILYEMLFGKRPFKGKTRYEIGGEILLKEPSYQSTWSNIPDDLIDVIKRALMKDPLRRYDNVSNMISDLLPFQAEFKEPMSDEASAAVKDSYPPPGVGRRPPSKSLARKPIEKLTQGLKSITPGGRSLAEMRRGKNDAENQQPKKFATPLPAVKTRLNKQTMLGMPPVSVPPRTSNAAAQPLENSVVVSKQVSVPPVSRKIIDNTSKMVPVSVIPQSVVPESPTEALSVLLVSLGVLLRSKAVLAVLGGVVALIVLLVFLIGGEDAPRDVPRAAPAATPPEKTATVKAPIAALPLPPAPSSASPETTSPVTPGEVTITINGLPRHTSILIGDKRVSSPITLPYSTEPVALSFRHRGYKSHVETVIPKEDATLEVSLEKKEKTDKWVRRKGKKDGSKPAAASENLADNPFGE